MPDQTSFQERLKRLENRGPVPSSSNAAPKTTPKEDAGFNYGKAIIAFSAVFVVGMIGLLAFTIQQTSG